MTDPDMDKRLADLAARRATPERDRRSAPDRSPKRRLRPAAASKPLLAGTAIGSFLVMASSMGPLTAQEDPVLEPVDPVLAGLDPAASSVVVEPAGAERSTVAPAPRRIVVVRHHSVVPATSDAERAASPTDEPQAVGTTAPARAVPAPPPPDPPPPAAPAPAPAPPATSAS